VDEDQRTRRASVVSLVRDIIASFNSPNDGLLGLFGAFAYDLVFQFEDLVQKRAREKDQRDIVLYIPDPILAYDRATGRGVILSYEFAFGGQSTKGLSAKLPSVYAKTPRQGFADHAPGVYQQTVETARQAFARGDLFEAVPGQLFAEPCERTPAEVFQRLCKINPSPYGALINLGDGEFLVAASPEMFVRSDGKRIETCPISGTIARGADAISDAKQIQELNSQKDEFELNMCTDVDRNDKARSASRARSRFLRGGRSRPTRSCSTPSIMSKACCGRASMRWTVSHARVGRHRHRRAEAVGDAVRRGSRAFVTPLVCGRARLPRLRRQHQHGPYHPHHPHEGWSCGGARRRDLAVRSDPVAEEKECQTKAAALFQALRGDPPKPLSTFQPDASGSGKRVLLIDHEDSFVHMLADYFRQVGATVSVTRHNHALDVLKKNEYDLLVLSPGPGRPEDFGVSNFIGAALEKKLPVFGVCLGVQAIGEYFGGKLGQLSTPAHGRPSRVQVRGGTLMGNLPNEVVIGRYHSLYVERETMPDVLQVTASTEDGIAMAIEHKTLPVGGVQFHPESLMSLEGNVGLRIVENAFRLGQAG
jgi:anthranilate synthase